MRRIAIFGGTFNPIHNGHIHAALSAIKILKLDKLILIPNNIPPHKHISKDVSSKDRFNMCCLAAINYDKIQVSNFEINKKGISYTIDTILYLKEIYSSDLLYLLVGSDMLFSFSSWKCFVDILNAVKICVVPRYKDNMQLIKNKCVYFNNMGAEIQILDISPVEISSTEIRKKFLLSENVSDLVPNNVEQYIKYNNLYNYKGGI